MKTVDNRGVCHTLLIQEAVRIFMFCPIILCKKMKMWSVCKIGGSFFFESGGMNDRILCEECKKMEI